MFLGRCLITVALLATFLGPMVADWNTTHVFNPEWPPHARFHDVAGLTMTTGVSLVGLWLLWRRSADVVAHLTAATAVPVLGFLSLLVPMLISGTGVEDHSGETPRILGFALGPFLACVFAGVAVIGYAVCRRSLVVRTGESR